MGFKARSCYLAVIWWMMSTAIIVATGNRGEEDQHHWREIARDELDQALKLKWNQKKAKNVIIFVGDGMDPNTVTATRILKGHEEGRLIFEKFPHIGLLKTYSVDKQVPDSASTASALFAGVKINSQTLGVDSRVKLRDCNASLRAEYRFQSIMDWAQEAGKDTGFVTNTRVTHATPGALYAHSADRKWECDGTMPEGTHCKDIGRQLIEDLPGKNIKLIMGGGRQSLQSNIDEKGNEPRDPWSCSRQDGRNLIDEWVKDKVDRKLTHHLLSTSEDLEKLDTTKTTDYVLGIFANAHLAFDADRNRSAQGTPSLKEMTTKAIEVLQKNPNGYVLVVEGGLIDVAHHRGFAKKALNETLGFDEAIEAAMKLISSNDRRQRLARVTNTMDNESDTLVIVTSDHGHSLAISGYPKRGSSILGIAERSKLDSIPFTTLNYATGGSASFHYNSVVNSTTNTNQVVREDPSKVDHESFEYHQQAAIISDEAYHSGGDVIVYATGPSAHLFHNIHEQNYVAHVVSYAAEIGPYQSKTNTAAKATPAKTLLFLYLIVCGYMSGSLN